MGDYEIWKFLAVSPKNNKNQKLYTHVQSVKSLFALPTERAALNPLPSAQRYASVN